MIPTYAIWSDAFRTHLGDTEVSGGQVWTDASGKCDPYLQQAYSELYKGFEGAATENIIRTLYGNLPAFTSYIRPSTFGAANFSEPTQRPLWERGSGAADLTVSAAVANAAPDASYNPYVRVTTTTNHGLTSGDMVLAFGILGLSDDVNDQWSIITQTPTIFDLAGCTATGTYTSGGFISRSTEDWTEVISVPQIESYPQTPGGTLQNYAWVNGAFRVKPASVIRQIKLIFYLSATAPTHTTPSASLGFDDSLGFLAYRAAALATLDRAGSTGKYKELNMMALGATGRHEDWGGLYGQLMRSKARSAARNPIVIGGYRNPRRNAGVVVPY